ncbi:hypothetical protein JCM1393_01710 [Clostridium carnis]
MIEEILLEYKKITLKALNKIKMDADVEDIMEKRDTLLKKIFSLEVSKDEIKKRYLDLEIDKIDKLFKVTIEEEQLKVKEELLTLRKRKSVNSAYSNNMKIQSFFSTQI